MNDVIVVDIFVEDRAHEALLIPLTERIAKEEQVQIATRSRSARGGHGRALEEFRLYQRIVSSGATGTALPDLLIAGIDGNCSSFAKTKTAIEGVTKEPFAGRLIVASPDPHVERWYMADPESFGRVVGQEPTVGKKKCERDHYKNILSKTVRQAGHPPTLGGIEFAREIAQAMDLYRASKNDPSLKSFLDNFRAGLRVRKPRAVVT
jgi:hypothetical protein